MASKEHKQIEWIRNADGDKKIFRAMIVGWQNATSTINALVKAFNEEYLKNEKEKSDAHYGMKEIAVKKLIISALHEMKPCIDQWCDKLNSMGMMTDELKEERKKFRIHLKQVQKFGDIRNNTFHFGDPNEEPDKLIEIYEEVDKTNLDFLNTILKSTVLFGEKVKKSILSYCS